MKTLWRRQHEADSASKERAGGPPSRGSRSSIPISTGRLVVAGLVSLGLAWVGWGIIAETAGSNAAVANPEAAVAWVPGEAMALDRLASREFAKSDADLDAARTLAERALLANPLDSRALTILGLIAERKGDQARADILMRLSSERTWHDLATQAWLVNRDIQRGEFDRALSHVDALMRVDPEVIEQTFPVLVAFTMDEATIDALKRLLGTAPPWRTSFLVRLSNQLPDPGRLVRLYAGLKESPHPADTEELSSYLERLIREGRFAEAYQSWRDTLSPQQRTNEGGVYNGDFAAPIDGLPFNWLLRPVSGMDIQVVPSPGEAKIKALQFQFSGARVGGFTVGELMLLPPGNYRLTGKVRAEGFRAQRGLRWHIFCGTPPNDTLALTDLVANSMPWTGFSVNFAVPAENCGGQWLKVEIPDRTASERLIEGQIWYKNIEIERVALGR